MDIEGMLNKAKELIKNSYAPYSKIRVAAVLVGKSNRLYYGVNVENSSYGLTMCAERVAIFNAITSGEKEFEVILIYSPDTTPWPCGACRQVMAEFFTPETEVIIANTDNVYRLRFKDLWPMEYSFKINKEK